MIQQLKSEDERIVYEIVNKAARAYHGVIPDDCYHDPYMSRGELHGEMTKMIFFGWDEGHRIVGVMGFQPVQGVTLLRHAYVLPDWQRKGIGARLIDHVKQETKTKRLLVGTWADARWAIEFYRKHGFELMPDKDELLKKYWGVPQRQIETSVVLRFET